MIILENPVESIQTSAMDIAERVLETDRTNIVMSQWQAEIHHEQGQDSWYIAYCAINRRLDPLEKPKMLHVHIKDRESLSLMFRHVEWVA